jgi:hypothetical protein
LGLGRDQSIDWIDDAGQDHRLTVVAIQGHERDASPACTALPFPSNGWLDGATDLEHGQFAPFAGSGVE